MRVQVSSNETQRLKQHIQVALPACEFTALPDGDALFYDAAGALVYAVERKTCADLRASFLSKHLQDQVARLHELRARSGCHLLLVVEGAPPTWSPRPVGGLAEKALASALTKLQLVDNIRVAFTRNVEDTALFYAWLAKRATTPARDDAPAHSDAPARSLGEAVPIASTARAKRGTKRDVQIAMLSCIPTISKRRAESLLDSSGSLRTLARMLSGKEEGGRAHWKGIGQKTIDLVKDLLS